MNSNRAALAFALRFLALSLVAAFGVMVLVAGSSEEATFTGPSNTYPVEVLPPSFTERQIERHECWTEGSGHPLPTGVIVEMRDDVTTSFTREPAVVSAAFDSAVAGEALPPTIRRVVAFCA